MRLTHLISTQQFLENPEVVARMFRRADAFLRARTKGNFDDSLAGKLLATVFYEPSTRTRFSFEAAMLKLGGEVVSTEGAEQFSSTVKGESLEDTIRIIAGYADVLVLRHPEVGAAKRAAAVCPVPLINAGDGSGEHPTQALLDLYTIQKEQGTLKGFTIALVGDLLYGRTIHSLIHLLSLCNNIRINLCSPRELRLPAEHEHFLKERNISFRKAASLEEILPEADIVYMTRIQKERFSIPSLYEKVKDSFLLKQSHLALMKKRAIIMHPLPRLNEIDLAIDADPRAAYFRQARYGLYVRMALLEALLA